MTRNLDLRERRDYEQSRPAKRKRFYTDIEGQKRFCHTCGSELKRRIYKASKASERSFSNTESKRDFLARHFCNAVCRASCRGAQLGTVDKARFY